MQMNHWCHQFRNNTFQIQKITPFHSEQDAYRREIWKLLVLENVSKSFNIDVLISMNLAYNTIEDYYIWCTIQKSKLSVVWFLCYSTIDPNNFQPLVFYAIPSIAGLHASGWILDFWDMFRYLSFMPHIGKLLTVINNLLTIVAPFVLWWFDSDLHLYNKF